MLSFNVTVPGVSGTISNLQKMCKTYLHPAILGRMIVKWRKCFKTRIVGKKGLKLNSTLILPFDQIIIDGRVLCEQLWVSWERAIFF